MSTPRINKSSTYMYVNISKIPQHLNRNSYKLRCRLKGRANSFFKSSARLRDNKMRIRTTNFGQTLHKKILRKPLFIIWLINSKLCEFIEQQIVREITRHYKI